MLSQTAGIGQERTLAKPQNNWINRRSDNEKQKERANREAGLMHELQGAHPQVGAPLLRSIVSAIRLRQDTLSKLVLPLLVKPH